MKRLYLGLAIHNHQPVGNFPWVFQQAYDKAYLPFLEALEEHPAIRLSLHYSGPLWDWLTAHQPDFLTRLARLLERGQVELMTGAYYEPILPAIPDADKIGQVRRMTAFLRERFATQPTGLWLAERVWEPSLPCPLARAGVEWTLVDDTHFKMVGLEESQLLGYYLTEEQGYPLKIFPSLKRLRYLIPWRIVPEVMAFLEELADEAGMSIAVMGDDGEKFGIWPQTYEHCWQKGWMEEFFIALEDNADWLRLIPLGEFARSFPPTGRVYLPCASYEEMMEWALPASRSHQLTTLKHQLEAEGQQDVLSYLKGGFWRHFQVKYPEANWMHKRMLHVHRKVYQAQDLAANDNALTELWQAQCNCPYWHGVFGGLYLADIRKANYQHILRAESLADGVLHGPHPWIHWERADLDYDGQEELGVETAEQTLWLKPSQGGSLVEWSLRHLAHNLLSTLARRLEAYHLALPEQTNASETASGAIHSIHDGIRMKEGATPPALRYDAYPRASLLDHFLPQDLSLQEFIAGNYRELGDWGNSPYDVRVRPRASSITIILGREGKWNGEGQTLRLEKALTLGIDRQSLAVSYRLANPGPAHGEGLFAIEWNINLLAGGQNPAAYYQLPGKFGYLDTSLDESLVEEIGLGNRYLNICLNLRSRPPGRLWLFSVETVANSESGLEKSYQATCLLLHYPFKLEPGSHLDIRLKWQAGPAT